MAKTQYGIIDVRSGLPFRRLVRVPHKNGVLTLRYPAFGPNDFNQNVARIQKQFPHPCTGEVINLREPTTSESISAAAYRFTELVKPEIFDKRWFQLGIVVKTSEGVYANPPKDEQGNPITDEKVLKSFLKVDKKVNGIWLLDNDLGYAPYETFKQGVQDAGEFAEGGLARVLEHTEKTQNLSDIADVKNYSEGINVFGFEPINQPSLMVASMYSSKSLDLKQLFLGFWLGLSGGYAFGVLDNCEGIQKTSIWQRMLNLVK